MKIHIAATGVAGQQARLRALMALEEALMRAQVRYVLGVIQ